MLRNDIAEATLRFQNLKSVMLLQTFPTKDSFEILTTSHFAKIKLCIDRKKSYFVVYYLTFIKGFHN